MTQATEVPETEYQRGWRDGEAAEASRQAAAGLDEACPHSQQHFGEGGTLICDRCGTIEKDLLYVPEPGSAFLDLLRERGEL